jgi:hypothetical protein
MGRVKAGSDAGSIDLTAARRQFAADGNSV